MSDEIMDIEGLGRYLKLAPVTLYKMVKEGKIPCRRIGKSLRFPKETIDRWLEEGKKKEIPDPIMKVVSEFAARLRKNLGERIRDIRLYGSWVRNEARIDSDIDVAVLVDRKDWALLKSVSKIASDLSLEEDRFLSALVIEWESHQRGKREGYPFHVELDREGISI